MDNHRLTDAQLHFYRENGFLKIEPFLGPAALSVYREQFDAAVRHRLENDVALMTNQKEPNHFFARVFVQCNRLMDTHEGLRHLMMDARFGEMAAQLAGVAGVRIFHDQALIKPAHGNPTVWHIDAPFWPFDSRQALSYWLALDDATLENGCLSFLPGTHQTAKLDKGIRGAVNVGELFNLYPHWRRIVPKPVPVKAGSVIWFNGCTAHAAGANLTHHARRALTCIFFPDGSTFNGKRNAALPESYYQQLSRGDVLKNNTYFPLLWRQHGV